MCEFKIEKKIDGSQIGEEIVVAQYSQKNQLLLKDILGSSLTLESALILDVNTLNQTLTVLEHPLIKDFLELIKRIVYKEDRAKEIENFQRLLEQYKN
jgi:hypothetical protein